MKRVLLLVCLIVSLVEVTVEHDRVYLLFSTAAIAGLVRIALTGRQHTQNASKVRALISVNHGGEGACACFSTKEGYTSSPHFSEDHYEEAEFTRLSADPVPDGR
jgi:hypothetical protein